jgi:hypothetical protein
MPVLRDDGTPIPSIVEHEFTSSLPYIVWVSSTSATFRDAALVPHHDAAFCRRWSTCGIVPDESYWKRVPANTIYDFAILLTSHTVDFPLLFVDLQDYDMSVENYQLKRRTKTHTKTPTTFLSR